MNTAAETKWTKGEWALGPVYVGGIPIYDGEPEASRHIVTARLADREEAWANARLIVSAGALYASLVECLDIARRNEGGEYVQRAEAALAKARGEAR